MTDVLSVLCIFLLPWNFKQFVEMAQIVQIITLVETLDVDKSLIVLVQVEKPSVALLIRKFNHIWHFFFASKGQVHLFELVRKRFCNILGPCSMKVFDCMQTVVELFEFIWPGNFRYFLLAKFILVNVNVFQLLGGVNRTVYQQ